jgi:hypothetical protein
MAITTPNKEATNTKIETMSFGALIIQMMLGITGNRNNILTTSTKDFVSSLNDNTVLFNSSIKDIIKINP